MRYEVNPDGTLSNGKVFFDMTSAEGEDALDGMKIDQKGNLYVSGPGGLWLYRPEARTWARLVGPGHQLNFRWGNAKGRTFYFSPKTGYSRMRSTSPGTVRE